MIGLSFITTVRDNYPSMKANILKIRVLSFHVSRKENITTSILHSPRKSAVVMELLETGDANAETPLLHRNTATRSAADDRKSSDICQEASVNLSKSRQYALLLSLLSVNFCMLMIDSSLYPFFPEAAKRKGLMEANIGIIMAAYDICRFLVSPLSGILVSTTTGCMLFTEILHFTWK